MVPGALPRAAEDCTFGAEDDMDPCGHGRQGVEIEKIY